MCVQLDIAIAHILNLITHEDSISILLSSYNHSLPVMTL